MKKCMLILMLLCLPALAPADNVVGNFENMMDGWVMNGTNLSAFTTIGVTNGTKALELYNVTHGWNECMHKSIVDVSGKLADATGIKIDITMRNDGGQIPGWWIDFTMILNSDLTGWVQIEDIDWPGVPWALRTSTVTFPIPQSVRDAFSAGSSSFCELVLITNTNNAGKTCKFWIDNIRVAGPTTAAYDPIPQELTRPDGAQVTSLCWSNLPNILANDVYFGFTEPNLADPNHATWRDSLTLIGTINSPAQQQCIDIPAEFLPLRHNVTYYWIVDGYENCTPPAEPNVPGDFWQFTPVVNAAPVFNLGPDIYCWLGQGGIPGEVTITLNPTVTDDGLPNPPAALTYEWTKISGLRIDDLVFPAATHSLTLPFTVPGRYEFQLLVDDSLRSAADNVVIYVGNDACDTYRRTSGAAWFDAGDIDQNCKVDIDDLQTLAANWLDCADFLTNCQ